MTIPIADCYDVHGEPQDSRVLYTVPARKIGILSGRFSDDAQHLALELAGLGALPRSVRMCLCVSPDNAHRMHRIAEMFLNQGATLISDRCGARDRAFPKYEENFPEAMGTSDGRVPEIQWHGPVPDQLIPHVVDRYLGDMFSVELVEKVSQKFPDASKSVSRSTFVSSRGTFLESLSYGHIEHPDRPSGIATLAQECAVSALADDVRDSVLEPYMGELKNIESIVAIWENYVSYSLRSGDIDIQKYERMFSSPRALKDIGDEMGVDCAIDAYMSGADLEHVLIV